MSEKKPIWTAKTIKRLRKRLRASQTIFGIYLGVSIMTVSRWERGISVPAPQSRMRLDSLAKEQPSG